MRHGLYGATKTQQASCQSTASAGRPHDVQTENPGRAADGRGSDCTSETNSILITSQPMLRRDPRARTTEEAEAFPHHLSVSWGQGF